MTSKHRLESLVTLILACAANLALTDRLALTDGAYGRVVSLQQYTLPSFTLSGWVNVTHFPEGIAPMMTYLSGDVNSQVSFFIRPEGVGILWGGPLAPPNNEEISLANMRRPRFLKLDEDEDDKKAPNDRRKREAIDYSGGLGDIENILSRRFGNPERSWSPSNFVDVDTLGVSDLMLSGSEHDERVAEEDPDRNSRAQAYSDWTNVPYELHMEESIRDDYSYPEEPVKKEPRIITQPSGKDDFVFINWNVPAGNQRRIPLSNNNWSPLWESTKENIDEKQTNSNVKVTKLPSKVIGRPSTSSQAWPTVEKDDDGIDLTNKWDPVGLSPKVYRPAETKLLPTKYERPVWPIRSEQTTRNQRPSLITSKPKQRTSAEENETKTKKLEAPKRRPVTPIRSRTTPSPSPSQQNDVNSEDPSSPLPNNYAIIKLKGVQIGGTTPPDNYKESSVVHDLRDKETEPPTTETSPVTTTERKEVLTTTQTTTKTPPRRNAIPSLYRYNKNRKTTQKSQGSTEVKKELPNTKRTRTRTPLWKFLKKPQGENEKEENKQADKRTTTPSPYSPRTTIATATTATTTDPPLVKTYKYKIPEPTLPPITSNTEETLQSLGSSRRTVYRSRPVQIPSIPRRPPSTITTTTTEAAATKSTSSTLPSVPLRRTPFRPTPRSNRVQPRKEPKNEDKSAKPSVWERRKPQNNVSPINRGYQHRKDNEFEKAMRDPKLVKEGDRAVVYAVPITNEKEFYEMYKKYQKESMSPSKTKMSLHDLYNVMRTGKMEDQEEEENENGIDPQEVSLYDESIYSIDSNKLGLQPSASETRDTPVNYLETGLEREKSREKTPNNRENITKIKETKNLETLEEDTAKPEKKTKDSDLKYQYERETIKPARGDIPVTDYEEIMQASPSISDSTFSDFNTQTIQVAQKTTDDQNDLDYPDSDSMKEYYYEYYDTDSPVKAPQTTAIYKAIEQYAGQSPLPSMDYYLQNDRNQPVNYYRPSNKDALTAPEIIPSYYQDTKTLFHEQLPPQYEKPDKRYDFSIKTPTSYENKQTRYAINKNLYSNEGEKIKESTYPTATNQKRRNQLHYISQESIPTPIHNKWVDEKKDTHQVPSQSTLSAVKYQFPLYEGAYQPSLIAPTQAVLPSNTQNPPPENIPTEKLPLDINFEKIAYTFKENAWYHLTFTWNGETNTAKIYVNGEPLGQIDNVLEGATHLAEGGVFLMGKALLPDLSDFDDSSQFEGEMSDVNLWATEMSPQKVDALFQCKFVPRSPQPIDWETTPFKLYDNATITISPPLCGLVT